MMDFDDCRVVLFRELWGGVSLVSFIMCA